MSTVLDTEVPTKPAAAAKPGLDIRTLLEEHAGRNYELHAEHVNPANVRTLKTIGFDRCYVRAEGPYLWDVQGNQYLDMSSGYGVFGLGREAIGIARLHFSRRVAETVDMVKVEPLGGGATARRVPLTPDRCDGKPADEACVYLDD